MLHSGENSTVNSVRARKSDKSTYMDLAAVFHNKDGYSSKIKGLSEILNDSETVRSILMKSVCPAGSSTGAYTVRNMQPRVLLDAGQPAQWLTHGEELRLRKEREQEALRKQKERTEEQARKTKDREIARLEAEKAVLERRRKRFEKQKLREAEQKKKRLEAVRRRLQRQTEAKKRRRDAEAKKRTQELGKRMAIAVRNRCRKTRRSARKTAKVGIRCYQFAAFLVVGVIDRAIEVGSGDLAVPR
ncbi:hypothetical protein FGB62_8g21 [Gracilaria domingensis]|nr:hypothetical protein FGB62_8g21 [Gracilaria domingensis]